MYLASPSVVAASAVAGMIALPQQIPESPAVFEATIPTGGGTTSRGSSAVAEKPSKIRGRVWVVRQDNIDTDMIYHNRYLTVTDIAEMGQYTLDNLAGWEDFAKRAKPGDIVVTGKNFGAGSSRQQAVDCFESLGIGLIIAESFGAIYERNAINKGFPIMTANLLATGLKDGDHIEADLATGEVATPEGLVKGTPFSEVQMNIYKKGGLLNT